MHKLLAVTVFMAGAIMLLGGASDVAARTAHLTKRPAGVCLYHHRPVGNGVTCSYECDPNALTCSQQQCLNGQWTHYMGCIRPFCTNMCG
jgi:hypothetical protein